MAPTHVLLVEGQDDLHFFIHLLKHHQIPLADPNKDEQNQVKVAQRGGIETLLKELPVWVKGSELQRLGIVIDTARVAALSFSSVGDER